MLGRSTVKKSSVDVQVWGGDPMKGLLKGLWSRLKKGEKFGHAGLELTLTTEDYNKAKSILKECDELLTFFSKKIDKNGNEYYIFEYHFGDPEEPDPDDDPNLVRKHHYVSSESIRGYIHSTTRPNESRLKERWAPKRNFKELMGSKKTEKLNPLKTMHLPEISEDYFQNVIIGDILKKLENLQSNIYSIEKGSDKSEDIFEFVDHVSPPFKKTTEALQKDAYPDEEKYPRWKTASMLKKEKSDLETLLTSNPDDGFIKDKIYSLNKVILAREKLNQEDAKLRTMHHCLKISTSMISDKFFLLLRDAKKEFGLSSKYSSADLIQMISTREQNIFNRKNTKKKMHSKGVKLKEIDGRANRAERLTEKKMDRLSIKYGNSLRTLESLRKKVEKRILYFEKKIPGLKDSEGSLFEPDVISFTGSTDSMQTSDLDLIKMFQEMAAIYKENIKYDVKKENCSYVTGRVLKAGLPDNLKKEFNPTSVKLMGRASPRTVMDSSGDISKKILSPKKQKENIWKKYIVPQYYSLKKALLTIRYKMSVKQKPARVSLGQGSASLPQQPGRVSLGETKATDQSDMSGVGIEAGFKPIHPDPEESTENEVDSQSQPIPDNLYIEISVSLSDGNEEKQILTVDMLKDSNQLEKLFGAIRDSAKTKDLEVDMDLKVKYQNEEGMKEEHKETLTAMLKSAWRAQAMKPSLKR
jgi:hypothetical protein